MREKTTVEEPRRKTVEYLRNKFEAIAVWAGRRSMPTISIGF
jgi:hypothetical protein